MSDIVPSPNLNTELIRKTFEKLDYGSVLISDKVAKEYLHGMSYPDKLATTSERDLELIFKEASEAFKKWSSESSHYSATILYNLARHVQQHARLFATLDSKQTGRPIMETEAYVAEAVRHLYHYAGWASLQQTEMKEWEPIGVCAIIEEPYFLKNLVSEVAPALAMGNVIVLFSKQRRYNLFADVCKEAGLPSGVFQIQPVDLYVLCNLVSHPLVDKVVHSGYISDILRKRLAGYGKSLSLHLPVSSLVVVLEEADLDAVVEAVCCGQTLEEGAKILVQESVYEKLIGMIKEKMAKIRIGNELDKTVDLTTPYFLDSKRLISEAKREGAQVFQVDDEYHREDLFAPTLITNVQPSFAFINEPNHNRLLPTMTFRTAKEAVNLANNCKYARAASVWSEKLCQAIEVAMLIKKGTVWVNGHNIEDAAAGGKKALYNYVRLKGASLPRPFDGDVTNFGEPSSGPPPTSVLSLSIDKSLKVFYGGSQHRADSKKSRPVMVADKVVAQVADANSNDIKSAVDAANKALPGWSKRTGHSRAQVLYCVAEKLRQRRNEMLQCLISNDALEEGKAQEQFDVAVERLYYWAAYADKCGGRVQETTMYGFTLQVNEPVGVIGIVCPASGSSLLAFVTLFAAAISRSNCVVMVPCHANPLPALMMYQVFESSDLPAGVVNVVTGDSDHLTKCLTQHRDLQGLWCFSGSPAARKFIDLAVVDSPVRTWIDCGLTRNWLDDRQAEEFLHHANYVKNIWLPVGDMFPY